MKEVKKNIRSRNLILRMAGQNRKNAGDEHSDLRHSHDLWSLELCVEGENRIEVESRKYIFKQGDIILIAPGQNHRFIYNREPFSCFSFKFELPDFRGTMKPQTVYAGHREGLRKRLAIIEAVRACLVGFCPQEILSTNASFTILDSFDGIHILEELLFGIVCHYIFGEAKQTSEITSDSLQAKMAEFIHLRGGKPVSVEELAEYLDYSSGYLRTLVYQHTGISTKRFIDLERIKIMKEMLRYSDIRIKELASSMEFPDVKYFTRFFRKYTGKTPRAWLNAQLKKTARR